jgi:hypothetical protein
MPPRKRTAEVKEDAATTSDYEKARDDNIARNTARMTALGLATVAAPTQDAKVAAPVARSVLLVLPWVAVS